MEIRYTTIIDEGVTYPSDLFEQEVAAYLADPNGWISRGYTFVQSSSPNIIIHLSSPETLKTNGCHDSNLSCAEMNGTNMYLNSARWTRGAKPSKLQLKDYRQYIISHEMGHILGYDHVLCPSDDFPAPIMMQQTLGIGKCKPNTKLTSKDKKRT